MNAKFSEDFLLTTETGKNIYNKYTAGMPVINYYSKMKAKIICENLQFADVAELFICQDEERQNIMRSFRIDEKFITGDASNYEKFQAFAEIMPDLAGTTIFLRTALELKRLFNIDEMLCKENARQIFEYTGKIIAEKNITPAYLLETFNTELAATSEDPADTLKFHQEIRAKEITNAKIVPVFDLQNPLPIEAKDFAQYMERLSKASSISVSSFSTLLIALEKRLMDFQEEGASLSSAEVEDLQWVDYTPKEIEDIMRKGLNGQTLTTTDIVKYRCAFIYELAKLNHKYKFTMQLQLGSYHGSPLPREKKTGFTSIFDTANDSLILKCLGKIFNYLKKDNCMPDMILCPMTSYQQEILAVTAKEFGRNSDGTPVKIQIGMPWKLSSSLYGMKKHFEELAQLQPFATAAGYTSNSSSLSSLCQHEIYRRLFCDLLGNLINQGQFFAPEDKVEILVKKACTFNARQLCWNEKIQ